MKKIGILLNLLTALCLVLGAMAVLPVAPARAATLITVDTLTDENDHSCADGDCSLRDAVEVAVPDDMITFSVTGTITLTLGQIIIDTNLTITGPGAGQLIISGDNLDRVFTVDSGKVVSINDVTISDGRVYDSHGAGINNLGSLTLNGVVVKDNIIVKTGNSNYLRGGGIHSYDNSTLAIYNSTISGNTAIQMGGGIHAGFNTNVILENVIIDDNHATCYCSYGGGVSLRGTADLTNVRITNNTTVLSGAGLFSDATLNISSSLIANNSTAGSGGGMHIGTSGITITLKNTTISGNSVDNINDNAHGAGISFPAGTLNLKNSTIANNTGDGSGGGIYGNGTINASNTIIAGNFSTNSSYPDCSGSLNSLGNNLIQNTNGCAIGGDTTGNITGSSANLNGLADNGGPTQTHALQTGSPAIDAGNDLTCESTDQRGVVRPLGSHCDIGAYEYYDYQITTANFLSYGSFDGSILESTETSGVGGSMNKTATTLRLGDDAANKQYRAILSFDTSSLPIGATITSVTLKFKYAGKTGTLPFGTHGNLLADVSKGTFKGNPALQLGDFKAAGSKNKALSFTNTPVNNWYSQSLNPVDFQYINVTGVTQFRLRFGKDDNNDFGADFLKIYSGNAGVADQPQLVIEYYVP